MAFLPAILSFLSRKLGQILRAVFGWSITGLFGRLPAARQTALSVALMLSIAWPLLLVGVVVPSVAAWAVAFVPLQHWVSRGALRIAWLVLALVVPMLVGFIIAWVAPSHTQRGGKLHTALQGYRLTLGFASAFLITVIVVPVLKLAALFKGWTDQHVYVQVKAGCYEAALRTLESACTSAGIATVDEPVPAVMSLPSRVLKFFARGALEPIVADHPRRLRGRDVALYLYPADLLLRGDKRTIARVRAAVVRGFAEGPAYLVQSTEAQHIEDEFARMWSLVHERGEGNVTGLARGRLHEIAAEIDRAQIPFEDWVILEMNFHRLERAAMGAPPHAEPHPAPESTEGFAMQTDSHPGASTAQLMRDALDEARLLLRAEMALAREEVRREALGLKVTVIGFAAAGIAGVLGIAMLLIAFAIATFPLAWPALLAGVLLMAGAAVSAVIAYGKVPKKPLHETRERLQTDVQILKERIA